MIKVHCQQSAMREALLDLRLTNSIAGTSSIRQMNVQRYKKVPARGIHAGKTDLRRLSVCWATRVARASIEDPPRGACLSIDENTAASGRCSRLRGLDRSVWPILTCSQIPLHQK